MLRCLLIFSFLGLFSQIIAQEKPKEKLNITLRNLTEEINSSEIIHLLVQGDVQKIKNECERYNAHYKYSFRNYAAISIPLNTLKKFSEQSFVERIEFTSGKGQLLNDSVLVNNNVLKVHNGTSPLNGKYNGEGVIVGVIDQGIELNHPDFKDTLGRTRILKIWDQTLSANSTAPQPYNYGRQCDSSVINAGNCSHVAGTAASNGNAVPGKYKGAAPASDLVIVSNNLNVYNWEATIADAVDYIFNIADSLGKPCVINISLGNYFGSHDGKDAAAQIIDSLILEKPGRAVVCAAGNAGESYPFHLRTNVNSDTSFTWFKVNPSVQFANPVSAVYFELWADSADFNNVQFAIGADKTSPQYEFRGNTNFDNIKNRLFTLAEDSLYSIDGNLIGVVQTWAELINGTYWMQVVIIEPDSAQYNFRFMTTGSGMFDVWSSQWMGASDMVSTNLPDTADFPEIIYYSLPDKNQSIVSSFTCLPNVITVGNYQNTDSYTDYNGNTQSNNVQSKGIWPTSSIGPNRLGQIKPDITSPGAPVLSAGKIPNLNAMKTSAPASLAPEAWHFMNGGTSMSSPGIAGIVALYLQKCPYATISGIMNTIQSYSKTDSLTGNVPNNTWGYGKADAFAYLTATNFKPVISDTGSVSVCKELVLSFFGNYPSFTWNTGQTNNSVTLNQQGNYYLIAIDNNGCMGISDTLKLSINPNILPPPPVSLSGDSVICSGDTVILSAPSNFSSYIWTNGVNTKDNPVVSTGFYTVTVTDAQGCKGKSDSILINVLQSPPKPSVSQNADTLISSVGYQYQWYFNGTAIAGADSQKLIPVDSGYYMVEVFHINGCSTFSDSIFIQSTAITPVYFTNGLKIYPNPTAGTVFIQSENKENYLTDILLYNVLGKEIAFNKSHLNKNPTIYEIDLSKNNPGIYFLYIRSGSGNINYSPVKIILQ
jgi:subtilisin family serine protease